MSAADRERWDARWRERAPGPPSPLIVELAPELPRHGRALDLAGGNGRHALWLAERGLEVTVADVSPVALSEVSARSGGAVHTVLFDADTDPLPAGPWDLVLCVHFLHRPLLARIHEGLSPGGRFVFLQATVRNLERHPHPSRRFLLEEGELPSLLEGLEIARYEERWFETGTHEARLVADVVTPTSSQI